MDVLVVSPFLPCPNAMAGAPRAIFDRIALLAMDHAVTVATLANPAERASMVELTRLGVALTAVIRHPEGNGMARWRKRLRLAIGSAGDPQPMLVQEFWSPGMCRVLQRISSRRTFDAVLVEHLLAAQYIRCLVGPSASRVILTDHDVRGAFPGHPPPLRGQPGMLPWPIRFLDHRKWTGYARWAYRRAALVTVPTDDDAAVITDEVPSGRLVVVPFGLHLPKDAAATSDVEVPPPAMLPESSVLFVGNFDHAPNRDAAAWLCTAIMPRVWRRHPTATLWLVGRNPTPEVRGLAGARVIVTGEVSSVRDYLCTATVFAAPLRHGGGIRMKTLEALAAGAPIVTTTVGAQGLGARPGEQLLIADDPEDIGDAIVRVLRDPELRARLATAGLALVSDGQARVRQARALDRALQRVAADGVPHDR